MSVHVDVHVVEYDPVTGKQKSLGESVGTMYTDYLDNGTPGVRVSSMVTLKKTGTVTKRFYCIRASFLFRVSLLTNQKRSLSAIRLRST